MEQKPGLRLRHEAALTSADVLTSEEDVLVWRPNFMSAGDTVKTTVRLPASLHWQFQSERVKRHLSNEKAISEAFAFWIAHPEPSRSGISKHSRTANPLLPTSPQERACIEILLRILRDRTDPARAAALQAVLEALSNRTWDRLAGGR